MSGETERKPFYKKWYTWAIALLVFGSIIGRVNQEAAPSNSDQLSGSEVTELAAESESSTEEPQSGEAPISEKELSAFRDKAELGARCSALYTVTSQFKAANGRTDSADIDAKVARATKLYAEKYAAKAGDGFDSDEEIAKYTERFSDMLERANKDQVTPDESAEVSSVMKKCDGSIEAIVRDI